MDVRGMLVQLSNLAINLILQNFQPYEKLTFHSMITGDISPLIKRTGCKDVYQYLLTQSLRMKGFIPPFHFTLSWQARLQFTITSQLKCLLAQQELKFEHNFPSFNFVKY
jgi:hypothetical protein